MGYPVSYRKKTTPGSQKGGGTGSVRTSRSYTITRLRSPNAANDNFARLGKWRRYNRKSRILRATPLGLLGGIAIDYVLDHWSEMVLGRTEYLSGWQLVAECGSPSGKHEYRQLYSSQQTGMVEVCALSAISGDQWGDPIPSWATKLRKMRITSSGNYMRENQYYVRSKTGATTHPRTGLVPVAPSVPPFGVTAPNRTPVTNPEYPPYPEAGSRGEPGSPPRKAPENWRRPPDGTNEKKVRHRNPQLLFNFISWATEATDFFEAAYDAIPDKPYWTKFLDVNGRIEYTLKNWHQIDAGQFVLNLAFNQVEDFVIGKTSQKITENLPENWQTMWGPLSQYNNANHVAYSVDYGEEDEG